MRHVTFGLSVLLITAAVCFAQRTTARQPAARPAPNAKTAKPAPASPRVVELPKAPLSVAVSPRTGAVAVLDPDVRFVTIYSKISTDGSLDGGARVNVGSTPVAVAYKPLGNGGFFLVACRGDATLHVFEDPPARANRVIKLSAAPASLAAAQSSQSPYVIYGAAERRGMGRVDLFRAADEGLIDINAPFQAVLPGASSDGSVVFGRIDSMRTQIAIRIPSISAAATQASMPVPPAAPGGPRRATLASSGADGVPFVADSIGQHAARGKQLFGAADFNAPLAQLPMEAGCFMSTRPALLGIEGEELVAVSTNTLEEVARVALPPEFHAEQPPRQNLPLGYNATPSPPPQRTPAQAAWERRQTRTQRGEPALDVYVDEKNAVVLVRDEKLIATIPLGMLKLPDEPFCSVTVARSDDEAVVGRPWSAKIVKHEKDATVDLVDAPEGLVLKGDTMAWTPKTDQIGVIDAALNISAARGTGPGLQRRQPLRVVVRRPSFELTVYPQAWAFSDDGKTLAVAGPMRIDDAARAAMGLHENNGQQQAHIELIDLEAARTVARRSLPIAINFNAGIVITDDALYVPLGGADAIFALSRTDLSDQKRLFTPGPISSMVSAGKRLFVAIREKPTQVYALPALEPVDNGGPGWQGMNTGSPNNWVHPLRVGPDWYWRGVLWDGALTTPKLLIQPNDFVWMGPTGGYDDQNYSEGTSPVGSWGVLPDGGGGFKRVSGQTIVRPSTETYRACVLLHDVPAIAAITSNVQPNQQQAQAARPQRVELALLDLIMGRPAGSVLVAEEAPTGAPPMQPIDMAFGGGYGGDASGGAGVSLRIGPGVLLVTIGTRVYPMRSSDLASIAVPKPLSIAPVQSAITIGQDGPAELTYQVQGGTAPVKFELAGATPGIKIDADSGRVAIDRVVLQEAAAKIAAQSARERGRITETGELEPTMVEWFKRLTGREPNGIPVATPIRITAKDAEQQTTRLTHAILIEVPPELLQQLQIQQQQQQQQQRAPRQPRGGIGPGRK